MLLANPNSASSRGFTFEPDVPVDVPVDVAAELLATSDAGFYEVEVTEAPAKTAPAKKSAKSITEVDPEDVGSDASDDD